MIVRSRGGEWGWRGKKSRASFSSMDDVVAFSLIRPRMSLPRRLVRGYCSSRWQNPGSSCGSSHRSSPSPQVQFWHDGVRSCPTAVCEQLPCSTSAVLLLQQQANCFTHTQVQNVCIWYYCFLWNAYQICEWFVKPSATNRRSVI